jgi:hypothetical protein
MSMRKAISGGRPADGGADWLLLVVSLPTESATARMRIWRALRAIGCRALRDGAYLLPAGDTRAQALQELADECAREGGSAWLMKVRPRAADGLTRTAGCSTAATTTPSCAAFEGREPRLASPPPASSRAWEEAAARALRRAHD